LEVVELLVGVMREKGKTMVACGGGRGRKVAQREWIMVKAFWRRKFVSLR